MAETMTEVQTRRRPGLIVTGAVLAIVGIAGALGLWLAAETRYDDAIENLAPAPVGCDTTLEFDDGGTYYVFAETTGEVGEVDGDCENDEQRYDGEDADLDVVLFDGDEEEVDLDRESDVSYDNGDSVGTSLYTVDITAPGEYRLRVEGDDPEVMARVGSDPNKGVAPMKWGAVAIGVLAVVAGLVLIVIGSRKRPLPASGTPLDWSAPTSPPGFGVPTSPPSTRPSTTPSGSAPTAPAGGRQPSPPPTWGPPEPPTGGAAR